MPITPDSVLILQMIPSGQVMTLTLEQPVILGRGSTSLLDEAEPDLDLTPFNAKKHGISRLHCQLARGGKGFTVTDLGSTNGTYLNTDRLLAHLPCTLADGDTLVLGTLHILVTISPLPAAPEAPQ